MKLWHQKLVSIAVVMVLTSPSVYAVPKQNSPREGGNTQALNAIKRMIAIYKNLKSYSGSMKLSATVDEQSKLPTISGSIMVKKPHFAKTSWTEMSDTSTLICDGANIFLTSSQHKNQYVKQSVQANLGVMRVATAVGMTGPGLALLLTHPDMLLSFAPPNTFAMGKTTKIGGKSVLMIESKQQQGSKKLLLTYYLNQDYTLRQMTMINVTQGQRLTLVESHSGTKINPELPDSLFTFVPATDAKQVENFRSTR